MKRRGGITATEANRRLREYGFSTTDIETCRKDGFKVQEVLDKVESILDDNMSTEGMIRDTFFNEVYPSMLAGKQSEYFLPKAASDFCVSEMPYLWYPFLPVGEYTVLMAPGGTGKSFVACGIAAAVSTGKALPGAGNQPASAHNVLLISAEDSGEVLRMRLQASGADLKQIFILDCKDSVGLSISDGFVKFKNTINSVSPRLVVIDPWQAFLGEDIDINRVNNVRPVLQQLTNLAKECDCALVLVSHTNKRPQGENINNGAIGSVDIINASRSALCVIPDDDDKDGRILIHTKANYAPKGPSVKFRISNGALVWTGFSNITKEIVEEATRKRKTPGQVMKEHEDACSVNSNLLNALLSVALPDKKVTFSYNDFKERFGEEIFGGKQAKRAFDLISPQLGSAGYKLNTGISVRNGTDVVRGFSIMAIPTQYVDTS